MTDTTAGRHQSRQGKNKVGKRPKRGIKRARGCQQATSQHARLNEPCRWPSQLISSSSSCLSLTVASVHMCSACCMCCVWLLSKLQAGLISKQDKRLGCQQLEKWPRRELTLWPATRQTQWLAAAVGGFFQTQAGGISSKELGMKVPVSSNPTGHGFFLNTFFRCNILSASGNIHASFLTNRPETHWCTLHDERHDETYLHECDLSLPEFDIFCFWIKFKNCFKILLHTCHLLLMRWETVNTNLLFIFPTLFMTLETSSPLSPQ